MADFVDSVVTQEITDAKDKLVAQADRAEVIINNWESCQPIPEAPIDGQTYGRKNAGWAVVTSGGAGTWGSITGTLSNQTDLQSALDLKLDSSSYTALDVKSKYESNADTNVFTDLEKSKLSGIESLAQVNKFNFTDAPSDGSQYARQNGAWAVVTGGGGGSTAWGSITGTLSDQTDLQSALDTKLEAVNLSAIVAPTTVTINNPEGNNAIIPSANTVDAGVMSNTDKVKLDGIESSAEVNNISDVNATDLTDGTDSSLHFHSSDRNRSNHTGTQAASTISDFDTEVSNNSSVVANTAKVSFPEAPSDGTPYVRQDGAWAAAGGGGGFDNTDLTVLDSIDNYGYTKSTGRAFILQGSAFENSDDLLSQLISKGFYPAGTVWTDVQLSSMNVVGGNIQSSSTGDTGAFPADAIGSTSKTVVTLGRDGGGNVSGMDLFCTIYSGSNAGKVYFREATPSTSGTWSTGA